MSGNKILSMLLKEREYDVCLKKTVGRYQLQKEDVKNCSKSIFDKLSKYSDHGNTMEDLTVYDFQHSIIEVAAIESVFCTLKKMGCIYFPLRIEAKFKLVFILIYLSSF